MANSGHALERLVAHLERVTSVGHDIRVESPAFLEDVTNHRLREHDVLLVITMSHHVISVALECRDRSRPVGVEQVEGFARKCADTRVNKGIIVSPKGFTKGALEKANTLDIRCLTLAEALDFDWMRAAALHVLERTIHNVAMTLDTAVKLPAPPQRFTVFGSDGSEVSQEQLYRLAVGAFQTVLLEPRVGRRSCSIGIELTGWVLRDDTTGEMHPVRGVRAVFDVELSHREVPFDLREYKDFGSETVISEIATAPIETLNTSGRLVIDRRTSGTVVSILWNDHDPKGGTTND